MPIRLSLQDDVLELHLTAKQKKTLSLKVHPQRDVCGFEIVLEKQRNYLLNSY